MDNHLEFFNLRTKEGFLRNIIIRNSNLGEWMVIVVFAKEDIEQIHSLMQHISNNFPELISLMYVINPKQNDTIHDLKVENFKGRNYIIEEIEGLKFKVGPKSFYQTNSRQVINLYKVVRRFASLSGKELVYDLYTGTGTIAHFLSKDANKILGIESVSEAIEDANENSRMNNINNVTFMNGDVKDLLNQNFIDIHGSPDVIITDPPRSGMHGSVIKAILLAQPARIVYISCNPATQARDIFLLSENYSLPEIQPVDMFPHTPHIENVALLCLK